MSVAVTFAVGVVIGNLSAAASAAAIGLDNGFPQLRRLPIQVGDLVRDHLDLGAGVGKLDVLGRGLGAATIAAVRRPAASGVGLGVGATTLPLLGLESYHVVGVCRYVGIRAR